MESTPVVSPESRGQVKEYWNTSFKGRQLTTQITKTDDIHLG